MVTLTREAHSAVDKAVSKADVLKLIPQFEIRPIFLRPHLNREIIGGSIGDRGGGKSAMDAVTALVDFMLSGKPCYSNMVIKCDIAIDDNTARKYGLNSGGIAHYESLPLDKDALLSLEDPRYRDCVIEIEEINIQYSNVRRFMTNTNVDFNEVAQQLRKLPASLLYNVIDEMFIDPQLRALTDFFVRTYDTAFDLNALAAHKPTGLDFKWKVYPMSGYLAGEQGRYAITHEALPPVFFHFGPWRGVYDSTRHQMKGTYSMSRKDKAALQANFSAESAPENIAFAKEWGWLETKVKQMRDSGMRFVKPQELSMRLGTMLTEKIRGVLPVMGVIWDNHQQAFSINGYVLPEDQ